MRWSPDAVVGEARRGEEQDEEADAVEEVGGVGADERGVVPRRRVRLVAEVEEQREDRLPRAAAGEGRAEQLVEERRRADALGGVGGGEAVQEREALGGDDVVAGLGEAAGDGGDAGGRGARGGREAEHLPAPCGWIWQRPGRAPACCCFRCSSCWGLGDGE